MHGGLLVRSNKYVLRSVLVTVNILESGQTVHGLGPNSQLISLSRKTPALLDMAAIETHRLRVVGQYCQQGVLGHSGDKHSTIGDVACLHHDLTLCPSTRGDDITKMYFLAGYSSKPLKAWRDSRVFWIVYDPDQEKGWLVPHDLSHHAVGDTVSATMPLVSKWTGDGSISVAHLSRPIQASLPSASPLKPDNQAHQQYIDRCNDAANAVDWRIASSAHHHQADGATNTTMQQVSAENDPETGKATTLKTAVDRTIAVFDGCQKDDILASFPLEFIPSKAGGATSLSPMHGPLKVLAGSCCANSRVVVVDGTVTKASSEIAAVHQQFSGLIFVRTGDPDVYNKLHQIRWNAARATRTAVLALTPDGCKFLCGIMPPCYVDEQCPTPMAGAPIPDEVARKLVEYALSAEGDEYFGSVYQAAPSHEDVVEATAKYISDMESKDFSSILNEPEEDTEASYGDNDFRRLMELVNLLSVSTSNNIERNNLGIRVAKFLRKMARKTANRELETNPSLASHSSELELLSGWTGNIEWALENREELEKILKSFSLSIAKQEGVDVDLVLQTKLDEAVAKKVSQLKQSIQAIKASATNSWKKTFNRVFQPPLEALMRAIGDNPRYRNYFPDIRLPSVSGVIIHASQSTAKQSIGSTPEDVMKLFHKLGATGFVTFTIDFLQTWKSKVINEICVIDQPGEGFNNPETYVPIGNRLGDGPTNPRTAYETDVRKHFVLPTFSRLPKVTQDEDDIESDEDSVDSHNESPLNQMPPPPEPDDLAKYLLLRAEFMLRDPEQGPRQPMWKYVDWLFHQLKVLHQVSEKQAAPLAMRALAFSISRLMQENPQPSKDIMEMVSSIVIAICFMSARGDQCHACIDTYFNLGATYVPQTKEMERNPWQIEVVTILSRAVVSCLRFIQPNIDI